jgi:DNA invertase Pin-like site-specific DNA recombinase
MERAIIYARYSPGPNQTESSIEGQLKECYAFAKHNGYNVIEEYIDRAASGKTDDRPNFQRMINDSYKKHFQYILVYQLDRFARNRYDSAHYKNILKKNGIRVLSARENITDDASGIMVEGLLESMAEYYSAELKQKIMRGMALNGEKGFSTGGNIALGYKTVPINPTDENSKKIFAIDEETAPLVRRIFEMYADGMNTTQITKQLNDDGYKTSRNVPFNKNSLREMLKNKRYIGTYTYKGKETPDKIPRIISDELFYKVAKMLDSSRKTPARARAKIEYLLTTKLFCGHCKEMMTGFSCTGRNNTIYRYYTCNGAKKKLCDKRMVGKDYIEDLVIDECRKLLTDKNINKIAKEVVAVCEAEKDTTNLRRLKNLLSENERKQKNLMDAIMECDISSLRKKLSLQAPELEKEHARIEKEIALEEKNYPTLTVPKIKFFLTALKDGDINDMKYRKTLINVFVNAIYLYDDKITLVFNSGDMPVTISDLLLSEIEEGHKQKCSVYNPGLVEAAGIEPPSLLFAIFSNVSYPRLYAGFESLCFGNLSSF